MKKIIIICLAVMAVSLSVMGCGHKEVSSKEEALYATRTMPEYREVLYYLFMEGKKNKFLRDDVFFVSGYGPFLRVHVVSYRDNRGFTQVVVWDDKRPPQQIKMK